MRRINQRTLRRTYNRITRDVFPGIVRRIRIGNLGYHLKLPSGRERPIHTDYSIAVPFAFEVGVSAEQRKIAVVCHIFHPELADSLFATLNLSLKGDVYISTDTQEKRQKIEAAFASWASGNVQVVIVENRGRDIAPKLVTFASIYDRYDLVMFLHSKKSTHFEFGNAWRDYLIDSLAGSASIVNSIIEIFAQCPDVGMVIPQHFGELREAGDIRWGSNFRKARRMAWRMDVDLSTTGYLDMPSGSMFWARSKALKPLLALNLAFKDFPPEPCAVDGTIAHALERLFLFSCEKAGFTWAKVSASPASVTNVQLTKPAEICSFVAQHRFDLIGPMGGHL